MGRHSSESESLHSAGEQLIEEREKMGEQRRPPLETTVNDEKMDRRGAGACLMATKRHTVEPSTVDERPKARPTDPSRHAPARPGVMHGAAHATTR